MASSRPLRDAAGPIRSTQDLRRFATILARHFDLRPDPVVNVGYVWWQGPKTRAIDMMGADLGNFTIARWALRGRLRLPIEQLEYEMVSAVGFWLDEHRWNTGPKGSRPGLSAEEGSERGVVPLSKGCANKVSCPDAGVVPRRASDGSRRRTHQDDV